MQSAFAINARFVTQPLTGVQRYCYELSQLLRRGKLISPGPALPEYRKLGTRVSVLGGYLAGHPWEQFAAVVFKARADVVIAGWVRPYRPSQPGDRSA